MKRTAALFFMLILCLHVCGCGQQQSYTDYTAYLAPDNAGMGTTGAPPAMQFAGAEEGTKEQEGDPADFANVVTIVSTPAPVITPAPTPTPTPFPVQTITPTPFPTPAVSTIRITKSPLSETLYEGGSCTFTAYADNAAGITWITVSPDAKSSYRIEEAVKLFPGLSVYGQSTNSLSLGNIPYTMNGWRIQAYFTGSGEPQYTSGAYLTVLPGGGSYWPTPTPAPAPTYHPADSTENAVAELSKKAYSEVYYAASASGFNVGSIANYMYWSGTADFNITVSNAAYQIIGEFTAYYTNNASYGYGPTHVMVYDTYGNLRANENLTGQPMSAFTALLNSYRY